MIALFASIVLAIPPHTPGTRSAPHDFDFGPIPTSTIEVTWHWNRTHLLEFTGSDPSEGCDVAWNTQFVAQVAGVQSDWRHGHVEYHAHPFPVPFDGVLDFGGPSSLGTWPQETWTETFVVQAGQLRVRTVAWTQHVHSYPFNTALLTTQSVWATITVTPEPQ